MPEVRFDYKPAQQIDFFDDKDNLSLKFSNGLWYSNRLTQPLMKSYIVILQYIDKKAEYYGYLLHKHIDPTLDRKIENQLVEIKALERFSKKEPEQAIHSASWQVVFMLMSNEGNNNVWEEIDCGIDRFFLQSVLRQYDKKYNSFLLPENEFIDLKLKSL